MFYYLFLFSLICGLINCQYNVPQIRKTQLRPLIRIPETTGSQSSFFTGELDSSFNMQQPLDQETTGYGLSSSISRDRRPLDMKKNLQKDLTTSTGGGYGLQATLMKEQLRPTIQSQIVKETETFVQTPSGYGTPAKTQTFVQTPSGYGTPTQDLNREFLRDEMIGSEIGLGTMTTQVGEKEGLCDSSLCYDNGVCRISENGRGFTCECEWGWIGDRCQTCVTECASNPCAPNKKCRAFYGGGYECVCPRDRSGPNCEIQNDACSGNPCLNNGQCRATVNGGFTCTCAMPFAGDRCERQWSNPCTENVLRNVDVIQFEYPWDRQQYIICTDIDQWVAMPCSGGTFFEKTVGHCVPEGYEPPICPVDLCMNGGECYSDELSGELKCKCKSGFTGERCEVDIDECELYGNPCAAGGGQCVDQINTYFCLCPGNRVGLDCSSAIENPCTLANLEAERTFFTILSAEDDHYLRCSDIGTFTVHRCASGLFWNSGETTCTLDRPVELTGICAQIPCKNGGKCVTLTQGFKCECKPGFTGDLCEDAIDYCQSNPCMNGGRCLAYTGGYTCVCPDKIVDDCCCHGIINPCPEKSKLIPGLNNYYPHLFPTKYIHCDFDGRAFVRNCASGSKWRQELLSCVSDELIVSNASSTPELTGPLMQTAQQKYPELPTLTRTVQRDFISQPVQRKVEQAYPELPTMARTVQRDFISQPVQRKVEQAYPELPTMTKTVQRDFISQPVQRKVEQAYPELPTMTKTVQRDFISQPVQRKVEQAYPELPTMTRTVQRDFISQPVQPKVEQAYPELPTMTRTLQRDFISQPVRQPIQQAYPDLPSLSRTINTEFPEDQTFIDYDDDSSESKIQRSLFPQLSVTQNRPMRRHYRKL